MDLCRCQRRRYPMYAREQSIPLRPRVGTLLKWKILLYPSRVLDGPC